MYFNIIYPSMPRSSKWSLTFRFPHRNLAWICLLPHTCHIPRSFYPLWFDHPKNICGGGGTTNHQAPHYVIYSILQYSLPLTPKCLPQHHILDHHQLMFVICSTHKMWGLSRRPALKVFRQHFVSISFIPMLFTCPSHIFPLKFITLSLFWE
jgi:hypothetical protein